MATYARYIPTVCFLIGVLSAGIPYWLVPYGKVNLPNAIMGPQLLIVGAVTLVAFMFRTAPFKKTLILFASVLPCAVMLRVIVEGVMDPTSHNLWPFEIVIAFGVGLVCLVPAALIGSLLRTLWR
ncbi:MAG TPA: hypothetical protein VIL32_12290 [Steroidobacteraceae bacterium]